MNNEVKLQIIDLYNNSKYTVQDIANKFNVCKCTVYNLTKKFRNKDSNRSQVVRDNVFKDLSNQDVQYWLGFLSADGSIFGDRIALSLKKDDEKILIKFKEFLGNVNIIYGIYKKFGKEYPYCRVAFRNKKIVEFLRELGITNNKSFSIKVNFPITNHFLRGLIDGDGSIYCGKRNCVRIFSASKDFVKQISDLLQENNIENHVYLRNNKKVLYDIQVNKNSEVKKIIDFLYNNANTFLQRKYYNATQIRNNLMKHLKFRELA